MKAPRWLLWIFESAGMIPPEIWMGFTVLMGMLVMNYFYPDAMMLF